MVQFPGSQYGGYQSRYGATGASGATDVAGPTDTTGASGATNTTGAAGATGADSELRAKAESLRNKIRNDLKATLNEYARLVAVKQGLCITAQKGEVGGPYLVQDTVYAGLSFGKGQFIASVNYKGFYDPITDKIGQLYCKYGDFNLPTVEQIVNELSKGNDSYKISMLL